MRLVAPANDEATRTFPEQLTRPELPTDDRIGPELGGATLRASVRLCVAPNATTYRDAIDTLQQVARAGARSLAIDDHERRATPHVALVGARSFDRFGSGHCTEHRALWR